MAIDADIEREINEVKLDMYCAVEAFRGDMREIRERIGWEVEGKDIFVYGERGAALEKQVQSQGPGIEAGGWREKWAPRQDSRHLAAEASIQRRLAAKQQPQQEQGYGRSY